MSIFEWNFFAMSTTILMQASKFFTQMSSAFHLKEIPPCTNTTSIDCDAFALLNVLRLDAQYFLCLVEHKLQVVELPLSRLNVLSEWHLDVLLCQLSNQLPNYQAISQILLQAADLHSAVTPTQFIVYPVPK